LPDFVPLQIKANFGAGRVESLNLVRTWQKPEYSWDNCFAVDRDYSVDCEPDEIQRNFHVNLFYAPNEPDKLSDDLTSLLLATRLTGDPEPATLKLMTEQSTTDVGTIWHTAKAVWPQYQNSTLNAVYRLDAKAAVDYQTQRITETTASFFASLPNEPSLSQAHAKLTQKLDWPINHISVQVGSTPASALDASLEYLGNKQKNEFSLQATSDLSGQKVTTELREQFTSNLARPVIVVPAAALQ
jgi:hypothetical protein